MILPPARGPLSDHVLATLRCAPSAANRLRLVAPSDDDDEQLSLFVLQQLSYRPIAGVDPAWEEHLSLQHLREELERAMEDGLRGLLAVPRCSAGEVPGALGSLIDDADGPSLSTWMEEQGTYDHLREFVAHRAAYQLQEADPHSFAIPRLAPGIAKTALLQLQLDEYGGHEPTEAHALLFADTMEAMGLDPALGPDLDRLPATTLATNTLLNRLGRSRRLLAACIGHLAVFEMTSVEPMARYAAATRRLLDGSAATAAARFYDVHVAADGLHARLAMDRLVQGFVEQFPDEAGDVLFGAAALLHVERGFAEHLLDSWEAGESSLRTPLDGSRLRPAGRRLTLAS